MQFLNFLTVQGAQDIGRRISADRAIIRLREEIIANDWHEQSFVTEQRIKAFLNIKPNAQRLLIEAQLLKELQSIRLVSNITTQESVTVENQLLNESVENEYLAETNRVRNEELQTVKNNKLQDEEE